MLIAIVPALQNRKQSREKVWLANEAHSTVIKAGNIAKAWLKTELGKTAIKIRKIVDVDKAHTKKEEIKNRT